MMQRREVDRFGNSRSEGAVGGAPGRVAAVLALAAVALVAAPAAAHHIMGIPHYKYSEEYPQIPVLEVQALTHTSELHFTHMPGTPRPGEDVRFKIYAKRRSDGEPLTENMSVEVLRRTFFGGSEVVRELFEIEPGIGPERNDFKFFINFRDPEAYTIRLHFPEDGGTEVIDFPVVIGETDDRPLIAGAFGTLVVAAVAVGVSKRRRKRKRRKLGKASAS